MKTFLDFCFWGVIATTLLTKMYPSPSRCLLSGGQGPYGVVLDSFFILLHWLIIALQPILVPLCVIVAWGFVLLVSVTLWRSLHRGVAHAQRLHQIPCSNCQFFTGDYHLKCTIHPCIALSEEAINCRDYEETVG